MRTGGPVEPELDMFDRRILQHLQERGDMGPGELSGLIHLSPSQCSRRLQRLKDERYIDRIVAVLSPEKLNLGICAYIMIKLRSHAHDNEARFRERIQNLPEVLSCEGLTGDADFILKIWTRDLASYNRFLTTKLHTFEEIETTRSSIVLSELKSTTTLSLDYC